MSAKTGTNAAEQLRMRPTPALAALKSLEERPAWKDVTVKHNAWAARLKQVDTSHAPVSPKMFQNVSEDVSHSRATLMPCLHNALMHRRHSRIPAGHARSQPLCRLVRAFVSWGANHRRAWHGTCQDVDGEAVNVAQRHQIQTPARVNAVSAISVKHCKHHNREIL